MELAILIIGVVGFGILLWLNDCNIKANQDVMRCLARLVTAVSRKEITQTEMSDYLVELQNTPIRSHILRLATFRNPLDLYSSGLARFF